MASIQEVIVAKLKANAGVTAIVAQRIYPKKAPAGTPAQPTTYPLLTYLKVGEIDDLAMGNTVALSAPRIQVSCWAKTYLEAITLVAAVKAALRNVTDLSTDPKIENITVEEGPELDDPDTGLHHHPVDFLIEVSY